MLQAKITNNTGHSQNEISYAENEIRVFEDKILELMEQKAKMDKNVKAAEQQFKKEFDLVEKEKIRARDKIASSKKSLDEDPHRAQPDKSEDEPRALCGLRTHTAENQRETVVA